MSRLNRLGYRVLLFVVLLMLTSAHSPLYAAVEETADTRVMVLSVEGMVTAGTTGYLRSGISLAVEEGFDLLVIKLNTPGGLVDATLDIVQDILNVSIPVVTFVAPRGAIAASAGTFILLSGHVAAMSPGSTCGAAMPIMLQPTEGEASPADEKTINFLAGHMRSIARERNRPADVAERFVTENLTFDALEAKEVGMVEMIADDLAHLMEQLDGYTLAVQGEEVILNTRNVQLEELEMTLQQQLINLLSNPQTAFILFLIGFYGIYFGLSSPGTYFPETVGVIAVVLALFGLGMFEINTVGILLLGLSVIFFIAELLTPTFGILTTAGVFSLVIGALLLPFEPLLSPEWFQAFRLTVLGMAAVTAGFLILVITKLVPFRRMPPVQTQQGMMGYSGEVLEDLNPQGLVRIRGELWRARSESGAVIPKGEKVFVREVQGKVLVVEEMDKKKKGG